MNKGDYLSTLLRSPQTVFSMREIALLWRDPVDGAFRKRINYYVLKRKLLPLRRGIYAKNAEYDRLELAVRINIPAYVSFETALAQAGVIFQSYKKIFAASYQSREIKCDGQTYAFRKLKVEILLNPAGIENKGCLSIASPERAFLDTLYLNKNYHFDQLSPLDQKKVLYLLPVYQNKRMAQAVEKMFSEFKAKT